VGEIYETKRATRRKWALDQKATRTQQKTALNACEEDVQMLLMRHHHPHCALRACLLACLLLGSLRCHPPAAAESCLQSAFFSFFLFFSGLAIYSQKAILKLKSTKIKCI